MPIIIFPKSAAPFMAQEAFPPGVKAEINCEGNQCTLKLSEQNLSGQAENRTSGELSSVMASLANRYQNRRSHPTKRLEFFA
ncbi:MAG: hypothetical protein VKJ06_08995 [Vampirovibrionales bacterium]|nr:hypothetical protein [Vampirovibrionales bacterium]